MKYVLSLAFLAVMLVSSAEAQSVVYQDRDRAVAVNGGHGFLPPPPRPPGHARPVYRPQRHAHGHGHRHVHMPHRPLGVYRPQPVMPPKTINVGPPTCGDKGHFDQKLGLCVANEIKRIDMPEVHKAYLAGCPGVIETRNIMRDGVLVEQQRCNYGR